MREATKSKLVDVADLPDVEGEDDMRALGAKLMVDRFGPECAAWLVWSQKKAFRRARSVRLVVPKAREAEIKQWFFLALGYLKTRARWSVEETAGKQNRVWCVTWKPDVVKA
jgi:hypothetical protein